MDNTPSERRARSRELAAVFITAFVMIGLYAIVQSTPVQDFWHGLWYDEPVAVSDLRRDLELTSEAERIFLATQPAIEDAINFNEHCDSHRKDVSLLGCYTGGKMYVYEVQLDSLRDSHKVTAAHELLHAIWSRLGDGERREVEELLGEVEQTQPDWVIAELELYNEKERLEELYTRAGTKLRTLPEKLEAHYAKYFRNRQRIVDFYENYQAPFNELKQKNADLKTKVEQLSAEIDRGRNEYTTRLQKFNAELATFNNCANTEGCFKAMDVFLKQREALENERVSLENLRQELNRKIDENNTMVTEYQKNQEALGELSNALNSNFNKLEETN